MYESKQGPNQGFLAGVVCVPGIGFICSMKARDLIMFDQPLC